MIGRQPLGDDITWMHSKQSGALQMNGNGAPNTNNQILGVLDSVLVEGFNQRTPSSVTTSGGSITFTFLEAHGYLIRQNIIITGADDPAINGKHKVVSVSAFTISINTLGVSVTTGLINIKVAPLGWESMFGNTDPQRRAYRSLNPATTQTIIYLDTSHPNGHGYNDSAPAKRAMISLCKNMTVLGEQIGSYTDDVNAKTTSRPNGSLAWYQTRGAEKPQEANSSINSDWVVVGNGDYFYIMTEWDTYFSNRGTRFLRDLYFFGDVPSFGGAADEYNCVLFSSYAPNGDGVIFAASNGATITSTPNLSRFFIKDMSGVGGVEASGLTPALNGNNFVSGMTGGVLFPNPTSQSLIGLPLYLITGNNNLRAVMPRLLGIPQNLLENKITFDLVVTDNILTVCLQQGPPITTATLGFIAFDLGD